MHNRVAIQMLNVYHKELMYLQHCLNRLESTFKIKSRGGELFIQTLFGTIWDTSSGDKIWGHKVCIASIRKGGFIYIK